ncbi:MAG: STAS domain-containing protein [Lachnospiraceae bacterium]|nr:STAS domain-containing protein [Lachnospiraceae bacterium]
MDKLKPMLFSNMRNYSKQQFVKDLIAGIIVAIIALPLSIALAIASGVEPQMGIYTAIVAGFVISFLGGSRVQIAGPTAAFATIVAGIVSTNGMDGLIVATIMAGIILIIMGFCRFGNLIKFIPYTITTGFTAGIAVTILVGQLKDFLGISIAAYEGETIETIDKLKALFTCFDTFNYMALIVGIISLAILIVWPHINKTVPPSLIAVIIASVGVHFLNMNVDNSLKVNTIGDLYTITKDLPAFSMPHVTFSMIKDLLPDALTIAILAAIESLLSAVVADGMIGSRHRSNMELIAQGAGNVASGLFGGIPATGAIARTAANIKSGGRTPIAGMVHAVVLALILVVLMPYAALIPMPTIAAILFMVAYNMSGWRSVVDTIKHSPKSDIAVLVTTFALTIVFDLVVAICVGLVLAAMLFMKRMADVTEMKEWQYIDDYNKVNNENETYNEDTDSEHINLKSVPRHTLVFEITGPLFFGASDKLNQVVHDTDEDIVILRMRSVPAMDATAMHTLEKVYATCLKNNIKLIFSHVNAQPMSVMIKSEFTKKVGEENFCKNIDEAIIRANEIEKDFHLDRKKKKNLV